MSASVRRLGGFLDRASPWLAMVLIVLGFSVIHSQGQSLHRTQQQITASSRNQIINRAANVEAWCGGINGGRDYNRLFVRRVTHGHAQYTLADLPCEDLIRKTLESPKRKDLVTAAGNPITYRLLQQVKAGK